MLKITEIYPAIQGETSFAGLPCMIVRLAGCNLDCSWCDTPQKDEISREMSIEEILESCRMFPHKLVLVTGGEPLLQEETSSLLSELARAGYRVLLETNGSLPLPRLSPGVTVILDMKCPSSGMADRMNPENIGKLRTGDEIKFVICDREDFDFALGMVKQHRLCEKTGVLFSPEFERMKSDALAEWILESGLPIRLNLQIHKLIWGAGARGR